MWYYKDSVGLTEYTYTYVCDGGLESKREMNRVRTLQYYNSKNVLLIRDCVLKV